MKTILNKYEQQIEDSLSKGEYTNTSDLEDIKELFREAAKNYRELQKTKSITLRINKEDLIKVKVKAKREGLAYQTLVRLLIRQYVKGETEVVL